MYDAHMVQNYTHNTLGYECLHAEITLMGTSVETLPAVPIM
jgi:hypothetical protein